MCYTVLGAFVITFKHDFDEMVIPTSVFEPIQDVLSCRDDGVGGSKVVSVMRFMFVDVGTFRIDGTLIL